MEQAPPIATQCSTASGKEPGNAPEGVLGVPAALEMEYRVGFVRSSFAALARGMIRRILYVSVNPPMILQLEQRGLREEDAFHANLIVGLRREKWIATRPENEAEERGIELAICGNQCLLARER